jgi:Protein of unknown function (DUF1593)
MKFLTRLLPLCLAATLCTAADNNAPPLRLIIETDAGGDPDDEQSLVRLLLYTCEWEVEGIIANRDKARDGENRNRERTGIGIVRAQIKAYGECWPNLVQHDPGYPKPDALMARAVSGLDDTNDAVNLIIAAVDKEDPRPVWYADWGTDNGAATVNMKRALDRILKERGETGYAAFKNKLRIIGYDQFPEHTARPPAWKLWINTFQPPQEGKRWYHRFSALTATAGGFDIDRDCLTNHGPLGALYPLNTTHPQKEGDTTTFLYLVPTGMNDPLHPEWGSWAGRYGPHEKYPDLPYFHANQADAWNGKTNRDNTLSRWAADLQDDFRARLDWCVQPREKANHPPAPKLDGPSRVKAKPGASLTFSAAASTDPDRNALTFEWIPYPEAGTYRTAPATRSAGDSMTLTVPADAAGKSIHIVLRVTDNGSPPLSRYERIIVEVETM